MTGYLQRLVSSAINPAPRVRPVLAPMFSTPEYQSEDARFPPEEVTLSPLKTAPSLGDAEPSVTRPQYDDADEWIPSDPPSQVKPTGIQLKVPAGERPPTGNTAHSRQKQFSRANLAFTSLLPEDTAPLIPGDSSVANPRSSSPEVPRHNNSVPGSKPTRSSPDEIQITIGRIEVTAVSETSIRPAVQPPRKKLSLDEYLKRADARSR
jgi:hypothetical protein